MKSIQISIYFLITSFFFACVDHVKEKCITPVIKLDTIRVETILADFEILPHTKGLNYSVYEQFQHSFQHEYFLNEYIFKKKNGSFEIAPCSQYGYEGNFFCPCHMDVNDTLLFISDVYGRELSLIDLRTNAAERIPYPNTLGGGPNNVALFYPKVVSTSVTDVTIFDLQTKEEIYVTALVKKENHHFPYSYGKEKCYDSTKHLGWSSQYYYRSPTTCFISNFEQLVDGSMNYLISLNPYTDQIVVYDSIPQYQIDPDTKDSIDLDYTVLYYSDQAGIFYTVNDSIFNIKENNGKPGRKINLCSPPFNFPARRKGSAYQSSILAVSPEYLAVRTNDRISTIDIVDIKTSNKIQSIKLPEIFTNKKTSINAYVFRNYVFIEISRYEENNIYTCPVKLVYDIKTGQLNLLQTKSDVPRSFLDKAFKPYLYVRGYGIYK